MTADELATLMGEIETLKVALAKKEQEPQKTAENIEAVGGSCSSRLSMKVNRGKAYEERRTCSVCHLLPKVREIQGKTCKRN